MFDPVALHDAVSVLAALATFFLLVLASSFIDEVGI
jgi:hypothetical protein